MADTTLKGRDLIFWGLVALAAVGWIIVLWLYTAQGAQRQTYRAEVLGVQQRLDDQVAASADLDVLRTQSADLTTEVVALTDQRDTIAAEVEPAELALTDLQTQSSELQDALAATQAELSGIEAQIAPRQEELSGFDARLAEAEQAIVARTAELEEVGLRLEDARAQEAETQQTVASLSEDAARLSTEAAEAETRIQEARSAEAQQQESLTAMRTEVEELTTRQADLSASVTDTSAQLETLRADIATVSQQRDEIQERVTTLTQELAERSADLAEVEQRMGAAMSASEEQAAAKGFGPGQYTMGPITVSFTDDGSFQMSADNALRNVTGDWAVTEDGLLELSNLEGDTGNATFPMTCGIEGGDAGFTFSDPQDSCGTFAGQTLTPAS